jgi:hypothetical protein
MKWIAAAYSLAIIWSTWPILNYGPTGWNVFERNQNVNNYQYIFCGCTAYVT